MAIEPGTDRREIETEAGGARGRLPRAADVIIVAAVYSLQRERGSNKSAAGRKLIGPWRQQRARLGPAWHAAWGACWGGCSESAPLQCCKEPIFGCCRGATACQCSRPCGTSTPEEDAAQHPEVRPLELRRPPQALPDLPHGRRELPRAARQDWPRFYNHQECHRPPGIACCWHA